MRQSLIPLFYPLSMFGGEAQVWALVQHTTCAMLCCLETPHLAQTRVNFC